MLRGALAAAVSVATLGLAACGDDPFAREWEISPDTVLLYSLARPELNLPSAFSFTQERTLRVEAPGATGLWDIALDTQDGEFVFLPPGALGINSRARITTLEGFDFDEVREAPSDTAVYVADRAVPVEIGLVYVVRTGQSLGSFSTRCVYYAKLEPLAVDSEAGTMRFMYDANPYCNDPSLVPPNAD